jgi:ABC-type amino acid transport substrate-binding protein
VFYSARPRSRSASRFRLGLQLLSHRRKAGRCAKSIVDAQVLRVAVIHFDLPSFHVRAPDGTLRGPEIEMAQQIGRALGITQRKAEAIIYWTTILAWLVLPLVLLCTKMA